MNTKNSLKSDFKIGFYYCAIFFIQFMYESN